MWFGSNGLPALGGCPLIARPTGIDLPAHASSLPAGSVAVDHAGGGSDTLQPDRFHINNISE